MANVTERKKYILTDATENNNKFWEYIIYDDGSLEIKWGRVGTTGQSKKSSSFNRSRDVDAKVREKTGKGYREINIVTETVTPTTKPVSASNAIIHAAAVEQLGKNNSDLVDLFTRLVNDNRHEIYQASGGQMNVDVTTGIVSTPIGVVAKSNIVSARDILDKMSQFVIANNLDDKAYINNLNDYLMLVPQKVGSMRGWHRQFIVNQHDLNKQFQFLDQLEASVDLAESRVKQAAIAAANGNNSTDQTSLPSLFQASVEIVTDQATISMIETLFFSTLNRSHVSSKLRPVKVYKIIIDNMQTAFDNDGAKMSDIRQLWHGTRKFNVLSILKNGLIIPPTRGGSYQIAGRMFGNGVYFSSSSSKSLNYSFGFWDNNAKDTNCFMFLNDVAMGKYYTPKSASETLPKASYDSTWAIPGQSGIQHDEMIVYRTSQCSVKYLIEFDQK